MKNNFHSVALIFLLVFLITTSHNSSAREMAAKHGEIDEKINKISGKESVVEIGSIDSFDKLMGLEECQNEDEECLKRRAVLEAHLDYIYGQHHKP